MREACFHHRGAAVAARHLAVGIWHLATSTWRKLLYLSSRPRTFSPSGGICGLPAARGTAAPSRNLHIPPRPKRSAHPPHGRCCQMPSANCQLLSTTFQLPPLLAYDLPPLPSVTQAGTKQISHPSFPAHHPTKRLHCRVGRAAPPWYTATRYRKGAPVLKMHPRPAEGHLHGT
jgi:hypothetical protein